MAKICIELDMAYDEGTVEDSMRLVEAATGVTMFKVADDGPAGWPLVCVTGEVGAVVRALTEVPGWGMDAEDAIDILKTV